MLATCYLTCGKIAPDFEQLELSVGESTVAAAVVETTGVLLLHSGASGGSRDEVPAVSTACPPAPLLSEHTLEALLPIPGVSRARLREVYKQLGDLGDVAQACRSRQVGAGFRGRCTCCQPIRAPVVHHCDHCHAGFANKMACSTAWSWVGAKPALLPLGHTPHFYASLLPC